ncbi:MAG: THUMP domain-containing protein [Gammaproteobacteria bacterium]|nr:THUMP domain-containing protein [Gammaproteobacteria bacterium]
MDEFAFFATAPKATTDLLARELASFGAHEIGEQPAGVAFKGSLEVAYRACLESRIANRVLLSLASFGASTTDELYEQVKSIDWNRHVDAGGTIAVDANVSSSQISHSHYAALRIKDAIVDTFFEAKGTRPSVDVGQPDVRINAHIHRDNVELSIDLSGTSLHQRGYRLDAGQAPLKENLAAAILLRARWPEMAADGRAFVDPMCGAGTLVLEAAMIAADIAPGLGRAYFGFLGWKGHHEAIWSRLCREAEHRREQGSRRLPLLMGFDRDRRILDDARENAARLGLEDHVRFAYQDIDAFRHDFPAQGLIATNPPYGRRLVATGELTALYRALGDVFKTNFQGWRAAVFTQDAQLGKAIGIRADRVNTLYNGAIACKLVHFVITEENFFRDDRRPATYRRE